MNSSSSFRRTGLPAHDLPRSVSARKAVKLSWRQRQQARVAAWAAAIWRVLKPYPSTIIWPLVVLAAVLLAGVWGVTRVAHATADSTKDRVQALATDAATWYRQCIVDSYAPVISLSVVIHRDPEYDQVYELFTRAAPELMALVGSEETSLHRAVPSEALRSLQLAPNGVIRMVYPMAGNEFVLQDDLFADDLAGALAAVQKGGLLLMGPLAFPQGGHGLRARLPVFIRDVEQNETFGAPDPLNAACGSYCYNTTSRAKFWGFSTALIELQKLHNSTGSRLRALSDAGYDYELLAPAWDVAKAVSDATNMTTVARSDSLPRDPVEVTLELAQAKWFLRVAPREGWTPSWYPPLLAGVIILAVAISALMFAVLLSRRQHQTLLEALLPREMIDHLKDVNAGGRMGPRMMESASTTADVLLNLLSDLLEGIIPDIRDIVLIRQQILQNMDIYQPLNLSSQLRDANLDDDVTKALIHQLGGKFSFSVADSTDDDTDGAEGRNGNTLVKSLTMGNHDYATLSGALAMILAPQGGWYDSGPDLSDAASDAALPTHDTEVAISPRPSTNNIFGRAASQVMLQSSWRCASPEQCPAAGTGGVTAAGTGGVTAAPQITSCAGAIGGAGGGGAAGGGGGGGGCAVHPVVSPAAAVSEAAPGVAPSRGRPLPADVADRVVAATASAISASCARMTEDGGLVQATNGTVAVATAAAAAASAGGGGGGSGGSSTPVTGIRRPPRKGDSHTSLINFVGRRRKSSLLTVSIADAVGVGDSGGAGTPGLGSHSGGKSLSNSSHPDVVSTGPHGKGDGGGGGGGGGGHSEHHSNVGRLWAATVSRRSITGAGAGAVLGQLLAKKPPTPSAPVLEEVERVLAQADHWQFDMWRLRDVTNGHPLSAMGFYLIQRAGLISHLKLKPAVLARLLRHIEAGYPDNPYHNATHAADVLQTLHVIIHGAQLHVHYLDHLGLLAAYFAAIVHDYGHPGLTNDFLVATSDPLAVRYNDRSPLENHHAAAAFSTLRRSGLDVLAPLTTEQKSTFRKQVIEMVLATDMKQHFSLLSHFSTVHRLASYSNKAYGTPGAATPLSRQGSAELQHVSLHSPSLADMAPRPLDDTERLLSLQMVIKAADLGHLGEGLEVHKRWLVSLEEEFFRQGDKERQLGIPISPLFDRSKQGVSKSQVGFYDFVALPLVHALSSAFPGSQPLMTCFLDNYNYYRNMDVSQPPIMEPRGTKLQPTQPARPAGAGQASVPPVNV